MVLLVIFITVTLAINLFDTASARDTGCPPVSGVPTGTYVTQLTLAEVHNSRMIDSHYDYRYSPVQDLPWVGDRQNSRQTPTRYCSTGIK